MPLSQADYKMIGGDGREYGPATLDELRQWAADGRMDHHSLVWSSLENRWLPAAQIPELAFDLRFPEVSQSLDSLPPLNPDSFHPAGFWARLAAYAVDAIIVNAASSILSIPWSPDVSKYMAQLSEKSQTANVEELLALYQEMLPVLFIVLGIYSAISLAYFVGFNGRFGFTPGKWLLGLQIVDVHGLPISYQRAFGRYSAELLSFLIFGLGYLYIIIHPEKRGLHDLLAQTRVIYRR